MVVIFMMQVILETSRLAIIVNGVLRKTTRDMQLNGECPECIPLAVPFDDYLHYLLGLKGVSKSF